MRLMHNIFSRPIEFRENEINVLVIENPTILLQLTHELINQSKGEEGRYILSNNFEPVEISKSCEVITDIFSIDINKRKIITKVYNLLETKIMNDCYIQVLEMRTLLCSLMEEFIDLSDLPMSYNHEIDVIGIMKLVELKIDAYCENILETVINYIDVINELFGVSCFVFLNIKCYFTYQEMLEIYKHVHYKKINLLLIEGTNRETLAGERLRIIDIDLCELY